MGGDGSRKAKRSTTPPTGGYLHSDLCRAIIEDSPPA